MVKMRLHVLLAEHRMAQKDLAQVTKIRQATISSYCSNSFKHIVRKHVDILCNYFQIQITDLIEYIEDSD